MWRGESGVKAAKTGNDGGNGIRLDVPFLPDPAYIRFLNRHAHRLESVHVGLPAADARHPLRRETVDQIAAGLAMLESVPRYALLNARFHDPSGYPDPTTLARLPEALNRLAEDRLIHGVVFADAYLLRAVSDAAPELARRLEAVPSVNLIPDRFDRVAALMDLISTTKFRPPSRWILDRSLNRNPTALTETVSRLRNRWPEIRIGLLANEGCLNQCPFKPAHDAHIALTHLEVPADTHGLNRDFGCMRFIRERPHAILASPFIRPEDVSAYAPEIDILKICGRTLGPEFLQRTIRAYLDERWAGNLLDLLDAAEWMGREYHIANDRLPEDFLERVSRCREDCAECGVCRELFEKHAERKALPFADLRGRA